MKQQNYRSGTEYRWTRLLVCLFLLAGCGPDVTDREHLTDEGVAVERDGGEIVVSGGVEGVAGIPVAVAWQVEAPACLESDGELVAAQLEVRSEGSPLLWWMADVPAGERRIYRQAEASDCSGADFVWQEEEPGLLRLIGNERPLLEYVHPEFDYERIEETKKPFHHIYAPDGSQRITKGVGGRFSHHRGIYFGYNSVRFGDQELDIWHAADGERAEHAAVRESWTGPLYGGHEVHIEWKDPAGETFADEVRRVRVFDRGDHEFLVDVDIRLASRVGRVELGGDLHHAGLQFRAAQYVNDHSEHSRYLRPASWADHPADEEMNDPENYRDLPWNALQFLVEGEPYTVAYLSHPLNPSGAEMSERLYGRFGEFIPAVIDTDSPLRLRYRFVVVAGHQRDRSDMEREYSLYSILD